MARITTSLSFDMRAPAFGTPAPELYRQALDMAAFADEIGVDRVTLMEHHGSEDGYLPQPFVMGAGVAARTRRCEIHVSAVILPLHDPVHVAEQIAVLDLVSGGRALVTVGAGYVASEFALFGASLKDRAKRLDEGVELILRALSGERFEAPDGRPVFVRPLPVRRPEEILMIGGGVEASARRAARFGLGFMPLVHDLLAVYDAECARLGRAPGRKISTRGLGGVLLSRDPDRAWARAQPHMQHVVAEYAKWAAQEPGSNSPFAGQAADEATLKRSGMFKILTPDQLVERARTEVDQYGAVSFNPLLGGLDPELGWECLELVREVMPRLGRQIPRNDRDSPSARPSGNPSRR